MTAASSSPLLLWKQRGYICASLLSGSATALGLPPSSPAASSCFLLCKPCERTRGAHGQSGFVLSVCSEISGVGVWRQEVVEEESTVQNVHYIDKLSVGGVSSHSGGWGGGEKGRAGGENKTVTQNKIPTFFFFF